MAYFDADRIASNIKLQEANRDEAVLQYRNTILTALQEVEDAIAAYSTEQRRQMTALARQQYEHSLASFLNVLDALAQSNESALTDVVALYKALGGGW